MGAVAVALRAALSTRNQWLGAAAVLVAVCAAVSFFLGGRRGEAQACEAVATELEMPWNDASGAQLRHGFESTQLPHAAEHLRRVEAGLDAWKDAYEALRTRACTGPVEQLQGQVRCLTDRARDVRALLSELRDADATVVNNAVAATRRLAPVDLCPKRAGLSAKRPIADILIGAFAQRRRGLITRNAAEFRRWFGALPIVDPSRPAKRR